MTSEDMLGELSEDVAATKYLNSKNLGVALTELPFEQPIGHKTFKEAMDRQIRWAIIRRHSFPVEYALEIISTGLFWVILASLINWPMALVTAMLWYGIEAWLATGANWPLSWWWSPITWVARDLLIPIMWLIGWFKSNFNWRGNRRFV